MVVTGNYWYKFYYFNCVFILINFVVTISFSIYYLTTIMPRNKSSTIREFFIYCTKTDISECQCEVTITLPKIPLPPLRIHASKKRKSSNISNSTVDVGAGDAENEDDPSPSKFSSIQRNRMESENATRKCGVKIQVS